MFHRKTDTKSKPQDLKPDFIAKVLTLFSNRNQRGATLPIAVALGVVMIGIAGLAIMNSGRNKTNMVADEQGKQAMAAAEAGVARIQALLVENPDLAILPTNIWTAILDRSMTAEDINNYIESLNANQPSQYNIVLSDIPTWSIDSVNGDIFAQLPSNILIAQDKGNSKWSSDPDPVDPDPVVADPDPVDPDPVVADQDACNPLISESDQNPQDVEFTEDQVNEIAEDLNDAGIANMISGESISLDGNAGTTFRFIGYQPPVDPANGGVGTLVVEGQKGSSKQRLEVKLPVVRRMVNSTENIPNEMEGAYLWAKTFSANGGGNSDISGNILDSSGCPGGGKAWADALSGGGWTTATKFSATATPFAYEFPPLPGLDEGEATFTIPDSGVTEVTSCTLPNSTSGIYEYTGGCHNDDIPVDISGGKTVKIYSDVELPIVSVSGLDDNPGKVIVYANDGIKISGNASVSGSQWKHIQYYVASGPIGVSGTADTAGFIFAPNSTITFSGTPIHMGVIWANSFEHKGGGNGTINVSKADLSYLEVNFGGTPRITIGSPQGYRKIEASN